MKNIDFLFVYEVKSRELENIVLLKYELEKRGYTIELINTWDYLDKKVPKFKAKVVIPFALYNDGTFKFISTYIEKIDKLVNLYWEQVGSNREETDQTALFFLEGIAKQAVNVCWGNKTYTRLSKSCGIREENLILAGHLSLDFLRKELVDYYDSKEILFSKYNIPMDKKICLFISSFSYVNLPETISNQINDENYSVENFIKISVNSQKKIIDWIARYLEQYKDTIFIYRPHPAESSNIELLKMAQKYKNFRVISELSVKQWILVSDIVYNWYSTSIAEIYAAKKPCYILRPIEMPKEMDLGIFSNAEFITKYTEFEKSTVSNQYYFPVKKEKIEEYYYMDDKEAAYIKICNKLEEVYKSDRYKLERLNKNQKLTVKNKIRLKLSKLPGGKKIVAVIEKNIYNRKSSFSEDMQSYMIEMSGKNKATKEEIENIAQKFKELLG